MNNLYKLYAFYKPPILILLFVSTTALFSIMFPTLAISDEEKRLVNPETAKQVMMAVDRRYTGDTRRQAGHLILIDKENNQRIRKTLQLSKQYGLDERVITQVLSPPELSGTTILAYEWDDAKRDDETWLYLPQLKKVKRLASTDKSAYFLGSDFTYADLTGLDVEHFQYIFSDDNDNDKQWRIIATPKKEIASFVIDETGYVKIKYWVDKEMKMVVKAQYWLKDGKKHKYYTASGFELIENIWLFRKAQMVLTQGGKLLHASVFQVDDVKYNLPTKDEAFTSYAMERRIN